MVNGVCLVFVGSFISDQLSLSVNFPFNNEIIIERKVEKRFTDLNSATQQHLLVTGRQLEPLPPKPVL